MKRFRMRKLNRRRGDPSMEGACGGESFDAVLRVEVPAPRSLKSWTCGSASLRTREDAHQLSLFAAGMGPLGDPFALQHELRTEKSLQLFQAHAIGRARFVMIRVGEKDREQFPLGL